MALTQAQKYILVFLGLISILFTIVTIPALMTLQDVCSTQTVFQDDHLEVEKRGVVNQTLFMELTNVGRDELKLHSLTVNGTEFDPSNREIGVYENRLINASGFYRSENCKTVKVEATYSLDSSEKQTLYGNLTDRIKS